MTEQQALAEFREYVGWAYRGDKVAQREAWNNYIDSLAKDQLITEKQAFNWSNPF